MKIFLPLRLALMALIWSTATLVGGAEMAPRAAPALTLDGLRGQIEAHVTQSRFRAATWGVKIVSLDAGRVWFEHQADRWMSPASNCKLFVGALALDQLGGDYRIVTPIYGSAKPDGAGELKGDVIVSGRGDPSWRARGTNGKFADIFAPMVAALRSAGVKHVTGDVVADATWLRGGPHGSSWTADDLQDEYGAEISALTIEDNYVELCVTPAVREGAACTTALLQPHTGLVIDNRTKTIAKGGKRRIKATRLPGENVVHLFGELPLGGKEEIVELPVPRPAAWFAAALKDALGQAGIRVDGVARSLRWPEAPAAGAVKLGEVTSPPLRELVSAFMKPSQNLETDLIFAHVGELTRTAEMPADRTAEELGVTALREFLKKSGLPADEVRFEEGSGLSRNNLATANVTVALLGFMAKHREAKAFEASLPIAGVDGTLRRRMKGTPAEGKVHAKTGTLRYANTLSGYVTTAAGERLAFSLMLNRAVTPAGRNAREEVDDIAVWLAGFGGK